MDDFYDRKKMKKRGSSKYNYTFGDAYPGMQIGHKNCVVFQSGLPVPARMGWLWNARSDIPGLKRRRGWQPGAVGKTIATMMNFKMGKGLDKEVRDKKKKRKSGRQGRNHEHGGGDSELEEPFEPKPTLKVQRKGDVFTIQINPLKDLSDLTQNEDPYIDCDPLVFKIIKKRSPEENAKVEARKMAKIKKQRDAEIRKALAEAAEDICKCAYMDVYCNNLKAIDRVIESCPAFMEPECICREDSQSSLSSNATWDIEYTPPFGCFDLGPRRKKTFIHVDTQYIPADAGIDVSQKYKNKKAQNPTKPNKQRKESLFKNTM